MNDLRLEHHRLTAEAELDLDQVARLELLLGGNEGSPIDDIPLVLLSKYGGFFERNA